MQIHDFETMYIAGLQEARSIEEMLIEALPRLADAADDRELADTFRAHHAETRVQLERVKDILDRYNASTPGGTGGTIEAMIQLAENATATMERGALRDATLISLSQRIEHYEMAIYGTLASYAKLLGRHEDKRTLGAILEEERAADEDLTDIADGLVNPHAAGTQAMRRGNGLPVEVAA